ncbi:MAG: hypothetical protein AAF085_05735 [Planctomycetota bacterium]
MSNPRFQQYEETIPFQSPQLKKAAVWLWKEFYTRLLAENEDGCHCAIWITSYTPAYLAIKPSGAQVDPFRDPIFSISASIAGFEEKLDELIAVSESYYQAQAPALQEAFDQWSRGAIIEAWHSSDVQKMHQRLELTDHSFGIYAMSFSDFEIDEVTENDLIAGDHCLSRKNRKKKRWLVRKKR